MKIYAISDIHGCFIPFLYALDIILEHLEEPDTKLVLLGDYIHCGDESRQVLDKIMNLQAKYGTDKVITLMGNHEDFVLEGFSSIDNVYVGYLSDQDHCDTKYIRWMENLPKYYVEGNTIFVHAGINEEAADEWKWETSEYEFLQKYPHQLGKIAGLDKKVVAGHIYTSEIADDSDFHDIYYDGDSHIYIDGDVLTNGILPILLVDTDKDEYYQVTENWQMPLEPYGFDE